MREIKCFVCQRSVQASGAECPTCSEPLVLESVTDLLRHVKNWRGRFTNDELWFRGHPDAAFQCCPSLLRCQDMDAAHLASLSTYSVFRAMAHSRYHDCPDNDDYAKWLFLMQHHGMPTRLLDWSLSPLVALYFAIRERGSGGFEERDASMCIVAAGTLNQTVGLAAYRTIASPYDEVSVRMARNAFTPRASWGGDSPALLALSPAEIHPRMVAQSSMFTLHMTIAALEGYEPSRRFMRMVTIPAAAKRCIREELDDLCVTEHVLFPDLDGLSYYLGVGLRAFRDEWEAKRRAAETSGGG